MTISGSSTKCWALYQVLCVEWLIRSWGQFQKAGISLKRKLSLRGAKKLAQGHTVKEQVHRDPNLCLTRKSKLSAGYIPTILMFPSSHQILNFYLLVEISSQFMSLYLSWLQTLCCWHTVLSLTSTDSTHKAPLLAVRLALKRSTRSCTGGPHLTQLILGTSV